MYVPPPFKPDRSTCLAFAAARGFGLVCAHDGRKPAASPLPFSIDYASDGTPLLSFHVARGNPLAGLADSRTPWLMAVTGPGAYVSADWYASPDQVPTWLYQSVHLTGPAAVMSEGELDGHLDEVSAVFESSLARELPWTPAKMTAGRRSAMKKAIVGVMMRVDVVEGSFKLNQHKSDADHVAVANALARQADPAAQAIAAQMIALRPQLDYIEAAAVLEPAS
ncbi:FMN-binding negative transcriptional regulator [Rhodopseudomonas pseudopalustris]|uniref:Negative transcriptional regulator, PaiB family n=1 Tax=Rhodopseudomonas pseudopalustris TaxID=1513892 RepID=A0A1H8W174_9BRAD|nr:FMN-binding negative transcriptional regulator [Rhodopseudomonas pseudopalustris]SEP21399.1 negative transcriptional regulator, PaiB family [Rhodopseudomonas pseudopalustris]